MGSRGWELSLTVWYLALVGLGQGDSGLDKGSGWGFEFGLVGLRMKGALVGKSFSISITWLVVG